MSDDNGPNSGEDAPNPFAGLPFFGDMMRALSNQGPLNWDLARQFAALGAVGDNPDPEPGAATRLEFNALADIADLHVLETAARPTGPRGTHSEILTTTRALWAHRTLTDLNPLFGDLAAALSVREHPSGGGGDPFGAMLSNLSSMMAPALMGMSIGSMVGALARRAFGQYELPLSRPHASEILVVSSSVDSFASEWSIPRDDMRMWVVVHELSSHAVLAAPAIADGLTALVRRHVSGFRPDPQAIMDRIGNVDPSDTDALANLQSLFSDPMTLLGAIRTPEQEAIAPLLEAHLAAVSGYIDYIVDSVATTLLGNPGPIAEAVRRHRVNYGSDADLIERLLGVSTTRAHQLRGRTFIDGVVERAGRSILPTLVASTENLPTPNELDAPGLWLARLGLD